MPDILHQPVKYEFTFPNGTTDPDSLNNEIRFPLVLPREESAKWRLVTEIISVRWDLGGVATKLGTTTNGLRLALSFNPLTAAQNDHLVPTATCGDIRVVTAFQVNLLDDGTPATSHFLTSVIDDNLTGGTGQGYIIPGDRLYLGISTSATDLSAHTLGVTIYYRQRMIDFEEFYGLLAGFIQNPAL